MMAEASDIRAPAGAAAWRPLLTALLATGLASCGGPPESGEQQLRAWVDRGHEAEGPVVAHERQVPNIAARHLEQSLKRRRLDTVPLEPTPDVSGPRAIAAHRLRAIVANTPTPTPLDLAAIAPALDQALEGLEERDRLCFFLREIEGRS